MFRRIISPINLCGAIYKFLGRPQHGTTTTNIKLPCLGDGRAECAESHAIQFTDVARVCVVTSVIYHKMEDLQRQCMCTKLGKTDRQNATKSVSFLLTDQQEQPYGCMQRHPRSLSCVTSFF